jgi:hypothetical protein
MFPVILLVVQFMPSFVGYDDNLAGSLVTEHECGWSDWDVHSSSLIFPVALSTTPKAMALKRWTNPH